ncbi:UDP-glucose 4-epimerase [Streptomyces sp. 846.5]|nr:NAD-dependent epimerase/dehydratase family protein [Streptomyces sp. 846.5]TDU04459.1 UDP-glucose 4-epimerase [Streptomyces sp. 846.5]
MRVLVTGASGYIGRAVVRRLLDDGSRVVALRHRTEGAWPESVDVRRSDILCPADLSAALRDVDAVCHLAALTTVRQSSAAAAAVQRQIITGGTNNLLHAMRRESRRRGTPLKLLNVSSSAVFGTAADSPLGAGIAPAPLSPYGEAKWIAEQAVTAAVASAALGATTLRVFNVAGRTMCGRTPAPAGLIPRAVLAAETSAELTVNGDGSAMRDFIHVRDVAEAVTKGITGTVSGVHRIHNLGAVPASVLEVIRLAEKVCGRRINVVHRAPSALDAPYLVADTTELRRAWDWEPRHSVLTTMLMEQRHAPAPDASPP